MLLRLFAPKSPRGTIASEEIKRLAEEQAATASEIYELEQYLIEAPEREVRMRIEEMYTVPPIDQPGTPKIGSETQRLSRGQEQAIRHVRRRNFVVFVCLSILAVFFLRWLETVL